VGSTVVHGFLLVIIASLAFPKLTVWLGVLVQIQIDYHQIYLGFDHNTHDIGAVQNHFIVFVDAAFVVVVMLIGILLCPFLPLIWLYISNYVV
jgi:hypothetical protein